MIGRQPFISVTDFRQMSMNIFFSPSFRRLFLFRLVLMAAFSLIIHPPFDIADISPAPRPARWRSSFLFRHD
jgi:hypothetical protein